MAKHDGMVFGLPSILVWKSLYCLQRCVVVHDDDDEIGFRFFIFKTEAARKITANCCHCSRLHQLQQFHSRLQAEFSSISPPSMCAHSATMLLNADAKKTLCPSRQVKSPGVHASQAYLPGSFIDKTKSFFIPSPSLVPSSQSMQVKIIFFPFFELFPNTNFIMIVV